MTHLRYLFKGLGAAYHVQIRADELLGTIANFGCHTQERVTNSPQGAVDSSEIRSLTAKATLLHKRLDHSDTHLHQIRIQLRSMQDAMDHKKSEFVAPTAKY